jgi:alpha-beta hydrolase superfamily lysophospholipase
MKHITSIIVFAALILSSSLPTLPAWSGEVTIPSQMNEVVKPELAAKYRYTEWGEYTKALGFPTYEWMCVGAKPKAIVLGIHGLTLHGRRYRVLARTLAVCGYGFISMDMRGFGSCHWDEQNQFSTPTEQRKNIAHEKSYEDIVQLAQMIRQKYPDTPIVAMGESLGCTFCVKLAGEHKDLVDGMILSAPAVRINPAMYASPADIKEGFAALLKRGHKVSLKQFMTHLVSGRQEVAQEMLDDPLILQEIRIKDLLATDLFCEKTAGFGKAVAPGIPVLILQAGGDKCVSPESVTKLMANMPSSNQTLAWIGSWGHLQLETSYMRSKVIDILGEWVENRTREANNELQALEQNIDDLGGTLVR